MEFRRPGKGSVEINIAPLVDVVFLLVIFFAVSTTFLETAGLPLELPSSSSTAKRDTKSVVVSITEDGQLGLDGEPLTAAQLTDRLRGALEQRESKDVLLRADAHAEHGDVVRIMDMIQAAGAQGITVDAQSATDR